MKDLKHTEITITIIETDTDGGQKTRTIEVKDARRHSIEYTLHGPADELMLPLQPFLSVPLVTISFEAHQPEPGAPAIRVTESGTS